MTYQWQSNTDGAGWVNEGAAESFYSDYTATAPNDLDVEVDWKLIVTCTLSTEFAESTTATFVTAITYCVPEITFTVEPITRVNVSDIDNMSSATSTLAYEDFTSIEGNMMQSVGYPIALEGNTAGNFTTYFTVWVDWNQNGTFEASEMTEVGSITNSTGTDGQQATGTINVPVDAAVGATRMRVIKNFNTSPTDPCGSYSFGQIEDYTINVLELEDCTGTPDGGTVTVTPEQGNPGSTYVVSATGYTIASGLTYQWQSNTDGAGWEDEGAATSIYSNYTATAPTGIGQVVEWQLIVTCTASNESGTSSSASFTTVEPDCGFETPSNGFENGYGNLSLLEFANDFIVNVNETFAVDQVVINVFLSPGTDLDAADISFYADSGNGPGAQEGATEIFLEPTSDTIIGSAFGFDIHRVVFDLPTPMLLNGNTATETVYWVGVMVYTGSANAYWEVTTQLNSANQIYFYDAGIWNPGTDIGSVADGVMEVSGNCYTLKEDDLTSFNFAYYPNPVRDVLNITSTKAVKTVDVYNLVGQKIMTNAKVENGQLDVTALTTGSYVFRVVLEGGQVETFKIIKK
jgi:hypothetical protein